MSRAAVVAPLAGDWHQRVEQSLARRHSEDLTLRSLERQVFRKPFFFLDCLAFKSKLKLSRS